MQTESKSIVIPLDGGVITNREPTSLPFGSFSELKNVRCKHPGFEMRSGQRQLHVTPDSSNVVLSLYQFKKTDVDEQHLYAQMSDGDLLEADEIPPVVASGVFGSEVFDGGLDQTVASYSKINDTLIYSNGVDQHQIYGGNSSYIEKCIIYKGSVSFPALPQIGEDYSNQVSDGQANTVAVVDLLGTYSNKQCIFIKTPVKVKSFTFTMKSSNTSVSSVSIYYYNGSWTTVGAVSDGTQLGSTTFAKSGTVSFTPPADVQSKFQFGSNGWWYQIGFSAALSSEVEISAITFDSDFQSISNLWDGVLVNAVEVYVETSTGSNVYASGAVDISELTAGFKIRIGTSYKLEGIYIDPGNTPNIGTSTNPTIKYWNGNSNVTVGTVTDESEGMSKAGYLLFPRKTDVNPSNYEGSFHYINWYELTWDQDLSSDTVVEITLMPFFDIEDFGKSQCNCVWKDRNVLSFNRWQQDIYVSRTKQPQVFNGADYAILNAGDGRKNKIVAMRSYYNELIVFQEDEGSSGGCVTIFNGYSPTTFGKMLLSSSLGTFNDNCVVVIDGVSIATKTDETVRTVIYFLSRHGVCMTDSQMDGRTVKIISDDIQNYFDPTKEECISRIYAHRMWLNYDSSKNVIRVGLVSGATATEANVFPVYDLINKGWSFDEMAQPLTCMKEIEAGTEAAYPVLQVAGTTGKVFQLNYGKNDNDVPIPFSISVELDVESEEIQLSALTLRVRDS